MDSQQTSLQPLFFSFKHTHKLNQLPMDIEKLMLFNFLSHICACTHILYYTVTHLRAQTFSCTWVSDLSP